jgi:predicted N-acetyltransferase YhbS
MKIDYLADHPAHLETVAVWQQKQFGYLTPTLTFEDRTERLRGSLQKEALPLTLIALSESGAPLGSASLLTATITHKHLTPWLSSVFVPEEHRGGGIASALSLRVLAEAERLGWTTFDRIEHNGLPIALMERVVRTAT